MHLLCSTGEKKLNNSNLCYLGGKTEVLNTDNSIRLIFDQRSMAIYLMLCSVCSNTVITGSFEEMTTIL